MAALGLKIEDVAADYSAEVWPDNAAAVDVFVNMSTQWRTGAGGVIGLDYAAIPAVLDLSGVDAADRRDVFEALRTMEAAALATLRKSHG